MPVHHALIEHGDFEKVLVCNAAHVKNVPGRKTDLRMPTGWRACWSAGCWPGASSPADVKAVRDVIRYRSRIAQERVSEIARLGNVLPGRGLL